MRLFVASLVLLFSTRAGAKDECVDDDVTVKTFNPMATCDRIARAGSVLNTRRNMSFEGLTIEIFKVTTALVQHV